MQEEALPRHLLQLSNKHQIGQREDTFKKTSQSIGVLDACVCKFSTLEVGACLQK